MKYIAKFVSNCPNDNMFDKYKIIINSKSMMQVEDINSYLNLFIKKHMYQEDITVEIAKHFQCKVTIKGIHQGVKIISKHYG